MTATGPSPIGEIINSSPFQKTQSAASTYDYVQDDTLYINEKMKVVMVSSGEQLNRLYDLNMGQLYPPGTIAYTPGFTNIWQLSTSGEWVSMLNGGNSGNEESSDEVDADTQRYIEYFVKTVTREITEINDDQGLITSIGDHVFNSCSSLITVSFPEATSIDYMAFNNCSNLTTVLFPKATSISDAAFSGCSNLTTISFPKATSISDAAFSGCSNLTTISFPEAINISMSAFNSCSSLTTVSFPEATSIGDYAFNFCDNMTDLYLPNAESTYTNSSQWFSSGMNVTVHYNTIFDADGNPII